MGDIDQLVRFEVANSAVGFRERAYGRKDRQEFLRDMLGLANAETRGPRYLIVGVRDSVGGARSVTGISEEDAATVHELTARLIAEFIEPLLELRIDERLIDGKRVVIIMLPECDDPPYLLKRNASSAMRVGSGWIRRGAEFRRLGRADLQRMFEAKLLSRSASAEVRIGFAGHFLEQVLHLPVMSVGELPSQAASAKIRKLLAAREVVEQQCVDDRTRMQRLVHAQLFGLDSAYQPHSEETLMAKLERASEEYEAADRYCEFEERAHKVNLVIENVGGAPFEHGTLVLDFPRMDGFEVVDRLWPSPTGKKPPFEAYPTVDIGSRTVRVQTTIGAIAAGSKGMAFAEPLRLCLREPGAGRVVPVSYTLYVRSLRASISGALRIQIEELEQPQAVQAINE
jgi:hypothetical protein